MSRYNDKNWHGTLSEKNKLYEDYAKALEAYCRSNGHIFVNPNPYIDKFLTEEDRGKGCMVDYIHPGAALGIQLYSKACLISK